MAILSDQDRQEIWRQFMQLNTSQIGAVTKPELRAAVNAIDQWLSDNSAALNAAIPQPARAQLTAPQKARILMLVISRRHLSGA